MADGTCLAIGCSSLAVRGMNCPEHAKEREALRRQIPESDHWLMMLMGVDNIRCVNMQANGTLARFQAFYEAHRDTVVRYRALMGLESPPGFLEDQYGAYVKARACQKEEQATLTEEKS